MNRSRDRSVFTPNHGEIAKFEKFLEFLSTREDCEIITVKEFYQRYTRAPEVFARSPRGRVPVSGYGRSFVRACRYLNRGKGNVVIATGGMVMLVLVLGLAGLVLWAYS